MPFDDLGDRLAEVRSRIAAAVVRGGHGQQVTIVAVTKSHGPEAPRAAWAAGLRDVGENRVQEALAKMNDVAEPLRWHLIGHLQRNKVAAVAGFAMVHSLDSMRLADALAAAGERQRRRVDSLVQLNVSGEGSKGGFAPEALAFEAERLAEHPGLCVRGIMTMAPLDASETQLRAVFAGARVAMSRLSAAGLPVTELSMGMSNDYEIAVEEGATIVRLGTVLFGARIT
ncbi:MAG: YggS family pyridoxal phosphate-dependent enzyme [Gemmatimonadaceae bacterium]